MRRSKTLALALAAGAVLGLFAALGERTLADEKPGTPGASGTPAPEVNPAPAKRLVFTFERYRREPWLANEGAKFKDEVYERKEITREQAIELLDGISFRREKPSVMDDAELLSSIEQYNRMGGEAAMRRVIRAERSRIVVTQVAPPRVDP